MLFGAAVALRAQQDVQVYEPGNGVSLPQVVSRVNPDYTSEAKAARIEGTVTLQAVVLADGTVGHVTVAQSLDSVLGLDREAVKAMKQWRFKPAQKEKKPVPVRVRVHLTFSLKWVVRRLMGSPTVWYFSGSGRAGITQW